MTCIRCSLSPNTSARVNALAEVLKTNAHLIPGLGLSEAELYDTGLFRGAIERIRGQYAASMGEKRTFAQRVLGRMQDDGWISTWASAGGGNRYDYTVIMPSGRNVVVELKGCLDGNNTNIFQRPSQAQEFYIWSVCANAAADPRNNAWSGLHTRLGAEIINEKKQVDGVVIWDMVCGTIGRPCPKLEEQPSRATELAEYLLPPPCLYLLPVTVPHPRTNPAPSPHVLGELQFMSALHGCFGTDGRDVYSVSYEVKHHGPDTQRKTSISVGGEVVKASAWQTIRRT